GTFLTRSGVLASVHSFTQSSVGPVFLVFFGVLLVGSIALLLARSRALAAPGSLESSICRETAFLVNNLLLVAITFTILLGTLFPLFAEAVQGSQLSVGGPYFNHIAVPIGLALLFLMGVGPVLPWGAGRLDDLQYKFVGPVGAAVGVVLILLAIGVRGIGTLVTFGLASFALAVTFARVAADTRTRRGNTKEGWGSSTRNLLRANPRRYGGFLAHTGVLLAIIGIAASQTYQARAQATLLPGQSIRVDGYTVTYHGLRPVMEGDKISFQGSVSAVRGGQNLGTFRPSLNDYLSYQQLVVTPAVREEPFDMLRGLFQGKNPFTDLGQLVHGRNPFEDLYLVPESMDLKNANQHRANRWMTLQVLVNPMVGFVWLGGILMGLGGIYALIPARRRRRVEAASPERVRVRPEEVTV
ncbi:MAG: cytochrome c-type biogenesis CcmF C-terminal domain-containing protein, partial [Chloroflexota bacterium]